MSFRYPHHRIHEIVTAPKCVTEGHSLQIESRRGGSYFDVTLDLIDGPFCDLRFLGKAGRGDSPATYDSSLLLDSMRVRGIGHCPVGRRNFRARQRIPAGWHQNICDPNLPTDHPDRNRHEPLPGFAPTDFNDFVRQSAALWSIDLAWEEGLL